jgi:hypothetical protein
LKADDLTPALELLVEHGYLRPQTRPAATGRPSEAYEVNPAWDRSGSVETIPQCPHYPPVEEVPGDLGDDSPLCEPEGATAIAPHAPPARRRFASDDRPCELLG